MDVAVDERDVHQNTVRRIVDNHLLRGKNTDTFPTFDRGTMIRNVRRFFAPAILFSGFLLSHGCSKDYNGFGHHSIKSVATQVEDYKATAPLDTGPLKRNVALYVLEEKRNAPNVGEQLSDYMGTHSVDRASFLETWRRYLATQ